MGFHRCYAVLKLASLIVSSQAFTGREFSRNAILLSFRGDDRSRSQTLSMSDAARSLASVSYPSFEQNNLLEQNISLPSSGISMQIIYGEPEESGNKPLLLLLHGSFHGAWCWSEHWMPYLKSRGYPVAALSWRGTGGTFAGEAVKKVKIMEHVQDLMDVLDLLPKLLPNACGADKPILIAHSFGGLAVIKMLEAYSSRAEALSGVVTMCSVPPSGNGKMTMRFLKRSLSASWKITAGFAMKKCLQSTKLCRELFFGGDKHIRDDGTVEDYGVSDADVLRYQTYFARDSVATIDLFDLGKKLPSSATSEDGRALYAEKMPPCLVMGAKNDFLVDREGLEETVAYFGLAEPLIVDSPHDIMLGSKWLNGAVALDEWITNNIIAK